MFDYIATYYIGFIVTLCSGIVIGGTVRDWWIERRGRKPGGGLAPTYQPMCDDEIPYHPMCRCTLDDEIDTTTVDEIAWRLIKSVYFKK